MADAPAGRGDDRGGRRSVRVDRGMYRPVHGRCRRDRRPARARRPSGLHRRRDGRADGRAGRERDPADVRDGPEPRRRRHRRRRRSDPTGGRERRGRRGRGCACDGGPRGWRGGRRRRDRELRPDPVRAGCSGRGGTPQRAADRADEQRGVSRRSGRGHRDRGRRRARVHRGLHEAAVGDQPEARAQPAQDPGHGAARQDLREPHGRPQSDQREAAGSVGTDGGGSDWSIGGGRLSRGRRGRRFGEDRDPHGPGGQRRRLRHSVALRESPVRI